MLKFIIYLFLLITALPVQSQDEGSFSPLKDVELLKTGIRKMAESTNSIHTSFTQEKHLSILSNKITSKGEMYFKKPQLLKWAYTEPYNYVIVLNGKEIKISDEGKVSSFDITSSQVFKEINDLIINSVRGNILQEDRFTISYFQNHNSYMVKLLPKEEALKEYLNEIIIFFDKSDFTVSSIRLNEPGDDYTLIKFMDKKLNVPIPDAQFNVQ